MSDKNSVLDFLLSRRSRPAKLLGAPGPGRAELEVILRAGARAPDHGKLEPWRFVVLTGAGRERFARQVRERAAETGQDADKGALAFEQAPVAVAVIASPKTSEEIPELEQTLSTGAVALGVLNAALSSGWGANWLTAWPAYDRTLVEDGLGLEPSEWVAAFVHMGTASTTPPERPRPDMQSITTWIEA